MSQTPDELMAMMAEDGAEPISDAALDKIATLALDQQLREASVKNLEEKLADAKKGLRKISEELLPNAMAEVGMESFTLANGYKVTIKDDVFASIRADYKGQALGWLRDHNLGDIVKSDVSMKLTKGEDAKAADVVDLLTEAGYNPVVSENVHPQTLKAAVKEQMALGVEFPEEFFSIAPFRKSVIKN